MKRTTALLGLLTLLIVGLPAGAAEEDPQSDNVKQLARVPMVVQAEGDGPEVLAQASDLAFQGNTLVAGSYSHGFALYQILKRAPFLRQTAMIVCPGPQADVSIWGHLVFVSVDTPMESEKCGDPPASQDQILSGEAWEGLRIFSIKDRRNPRQLAALYTPCGAHTHTMVPGGKNTVYVYVSSYPLSGQSDDCNYASHRKVSIVEVPLKSPDKAEIVGEVDVTPTIGCHDITVFPKKKLAAAACVAESQMWDISNPAEPEIISRIRNPMINIHHSSGMTWDGKVLVIGDEFSGAVGNGCLGSSDSPVGALWFYDIEDPENPQMLSHFGPTRTALPSNADEAGYSRCTAHNFNVIPMKDQDKYILVNSYYTAGMSAIDFSDPSNPEEVGFYVPMVDDNLPSLWSSYWYQGRIYASDFEAHGGISVYEFDGTTSQRTTKFFKGRLNPQTQLASFK